MAEIQFSDEKNSDLSIVCFGASAGGLESYLSILARLPAETGLIFIIIHHQPSDWKSLLPEIIPRYTVMPVTLVEDGEIAQANRVYVGPPGMQVYMSGESLFLRKLLWASLPNKRQKLRDRLCLRRPQPSWSLVRYPTRGSSPALQ